MLEFQTKYLRMVEMIEQKKLDGILLQKVSSFAWATCGAASFVNTASTNGVADLLVTPQYCKIFTTNIEAPRLEKEEQLNLQGWEFQVFPWYTYSDDLRQAIRGMKLGSDGVQSGMKDLSDEISQLRAWLTPEETERFRMVARLCAATMDASIHAVRPGMSEHEIAGRVAQEAEIRGLQAIVNLVATDERIFAFRHPLPTTKKLEKYAMLVLCGRRGGLVASITRLIHFGSLPEDLRLKEKACAYIDAVLIQATRPGATLGEVIEHELQAYKEVGYPDEWKEHHQGGAAAYEPREFFGLPGSQVPVRLGQAYAWNPSIQGIKSEDTILVGESENEQATQISGWPALEVETGGQTISRPAVLEVT